VEFLHRFAVGGKRLFKRIFLGLVFLQYVLLGYVAFLRNILTQSGPFDKETHLLPLEIAGTSVIVINPEIGMVEEKMDGPVMEAVTRPLRLKMADQRMAEKRQVADEIQDLVADKFVLETEGPADDFLVIKDDRIVQASPEGQAALPEVRYIPQEPESPGGSNLFEKNLSGQSERNLLPADERMGKINGIGQAKIRVGRKRQAGLSVLNSVRLDNPNHFGCQRKGTQA